MTLSFLKQREIDMTEGKLLPKIMVFAFPLMLTGILQLLFNTADMIVVGKFVSDTAFTAVGSTSSLVNLIVNTFIGLSVGAGIVMSKYYGSKNEESASKTLHTAMLTGLISGITIAVIGCVFSRDMLVLMDTVDECLPMATEYLFIYFLGAPFNLVYNFGASMLRAMGDTVHPLLFLFVAGILNVIVNLISVLVFNMGVVGVACATITSQAVSAILVVITLIKNKGFVKLEPKKIRMHKKVFIEILRLGIPSGVQSSLFSISNVIIQKTINPFGEQVVAANTAANQLEAFIYTMMDAIASATVTAVGQNYGANNFDRIKKTIFICAIFITVTGLLGSGIEILFHRPLLNLYVDDEATAQIAFTRLVIITVPYFTCGLMNVVNNAIRGIGYSIVPMVIVFIGTCAFRLFWIYCIFPLNPVISSIYISYPISWILTALAGTVALLILFRLRRQQKEKPLAA